jgi:hypothetical protein
MSAGVIPFDQIFPSSKPLTFDEIFGSPATPVQRKGGVEGIAAGRPQPATPPKPPVPLTAAELKDLGSAAAPYLIDGEAGITGLRLPPLAARSIRAMTMAGLTFQQAKDAWNGLIMAKQAYLKHGPASPQFHQAAKAAENNAGHAALGSLSIAHGAAGLLGPDEARKHFKNNPKAFAAAESEMRAAVNPEQMKTPEGKRRAISIFHSVYTGNSGHVPRGT